MTVATQARLLAEEENIRHLPDAIAGIREYDPVSALLFQWTATTGDARTGHVPDRLGLAHPGGAFTGGPATHGAVGDDVDEDTDR